MGACLMMRRGELFDERFFLYCEDTDLCARLLRRGDILYVPEAQFFHELGTSSKAHRWKAIAMYNSGKELYFRIHHGPVKASWCWLLDRLGGLLRCLAWFVVYAMYFGTNWRAKGNMEAFWKVSTAPASYDGLKTRS